MSSKKRLRNVTNSKISSGSSSKNYKATSRSFKMKSSPKHKNSSVYYSKKITTTSSNWKN